MPRVHSSSPSSTPAPLPETPATIPDHGDNASDTLEAFKPADTAAQGAVAGSLVGAGQVPAAAPPPAPSPEAPVASSSSSSAGSWAPAGPFASLVRRNPGAVALRQVLMPGAYGYMPPEIHPGMGAEVRRLTTVLDGTVDLRAYAPHHASRGHAAIVTFHGNACTADSMDPMWQDYRRFGHVIAVNLPGYGKSTTPADGADLELHVAATVQAVRDHLLHELGFSPSTIVWYGMSLGGSAAVIGLQMLPGSHLFVQDTFTSVTDVAGNFLSKTPVGRFGASIASFAVSSGLPAGVGRPNLQYVTDGLNSAAKLAQMQAEGVHAERGSRFLVIGAANDELMAPTYPGTLAHSYYGEDVPIDCLHVVPGATHCSSIDHDGEAVRKIETFLRKT